MTFNNIPKNLVDDLCACMDRIEVAVRADERQRLLDRFRAEFPERPVAKPTVTNVPMTGMHGEPLHESDPQPKTYDPAAAFDYAGQRLNESHRRMIAWLSTGTFMAVPTLAGHLNIKKQSVYAYMSALRGAGYEIERRSTGNRKGGYTHIYRLAKAG
jgi:biotin operon repressor